MVVVATAERGPRVDVSLTTIPTSLSAVPTLVRQLLPDVSKVLEADEEARHEALKKARALVLALQTPRETMVEHCWAQVSEKK